MTKAEIAAWEALARAAAPLRAIQRRKEPHTAQADDQAEGGKECRLNQS